MLSEVKDYLEQVRYHLRLDPSLERQVISELFVHFEEKIAEIRANGSSEKEATARAIEAFGRDRVVARQMYEAYGKGNWADAALAYLPHVIMAALFAFHLWHHVLLVPSVFAFIILVTLFGWWHGKPNWLYSWLTYSLVPLLVVIYASISTLEHAIFFLTGLENAFPNIWLFCLVCALFALFLWIIIRTTIRVVKRDWILASLMLVPIPILGSWFYNIEQAGGLFHDSGVILHQWDTPMALAFLVLGLMTATFIRLRQRILKVEAVIIIGSITLAMVGNNLWGGLSFLGLSLLFLFMLAFLFIPALIEKGVGHGEEKPDTWWSIYQEQSPTAK